MQKRSHIAAVLMTSAFCLMANAKTLRWNVLEEYGMNAEGIQKAVNAARLHFTRAPDDIIILEFDKGSFWLEDHGPGKGTIDLSGIRPGPTGRLVFQGKGMNETILVFADNKHALYGRDVYRVTFADMHMTRKNYTVSQGQVVEVTPGHVILDIHPGFPTPEEIFDHSSQQGRYLRRYTNSAADPELIQDDNWHIPWTRAQHINGQRWQLDLKQKNKLANYSEGDLVGIKSKHSKAEGVFGSGQAYWFNAGSDFLFQSVKWTHKSRGVFRGGFENVQVVDCVVDRAPPINGQTSCLATPGGGPQIGQPDDPATSGHLVRNCRFIALGDDAVAFFNATGEISDCYIRDSFGRGILVANAPDTVLRNNTVIRCPIQKTRHWRFLKDQTNPIEQNKDADQ